MVILASVSKILAKDVGQARPLPSLSLDSVLHVLDCFFNLIFVSKLIRFLNCSVTFSRSLSLCRIGVQDQ